MVHIGTVLEIDNNKTYVFTMDCGLTTIRTKKDYFVGKQITFTKRDMHFNLIQHKATIIKSFISIAAVLAIVFTTVLVKPLFEPKLIIDAKAVAVLSVDINPSIEIDVNKDNLIVSAKSINEDGQKVLDAIDLTGMTIKDGVKKIVETAKAMGYITDDKKIVLVSAAIGAESTDVSDEYADQLKGILSSLEESEEETNVLTVFIEDPDIIQSAIANNLSIGREFLYKYAVINNGDITADDVRKGTLVDLLEKLNALEQNGELDDELKSQAVESKASIFPDSFNANVQAKAVTGGVELKWSKSPVSEKFDFYKIVASKSNQSPSYPQDGYALAVTDISSTSAVINLNSAYYNGDVGGKLLPGETYYFSVSYVINGNVYKSNAVKVAMPKAQAVTTTAETTKTTTTITTTTEPAQTTTPPPTNSFSPQMQLNTTNDKLNFVWNPVSDAVTYNGKAYSGFKYYKIVASKSKNNPIYPTDGYAAYYSNINTKSATLNPNCSYNNGDVGGMLKAGETYYFTITYCFKNGGNFISNSVSIKVPGTPPATTTVAEIAELNPTLAITAINGGMNFSWTKASAQVKYNGEVYTGFWGYKIVASIVDPSSPTTPTYPENGYAQYITGIDNNSANVMSNSPYNSYGTAIGDKLIAGQTYNFSITYLYGNDKKIYIPGQQFTVPMV